jgi:hypothetical protein
MEFENAKPDVDFGFEGDETEPVPSAVDRNQLRIAHLSFRTIKRPVLAVRALREVLHRESGVLASAPLRRGPRIGRSVLLHDETALTRLIEAISREVGYQAGVHARAFPVPPPEVLERPVFIVGAPCSGTTLLFSVLARCPGVFTIGGESHAVLDGSGRPLTDAGSRLDADQATPDDKIVIPAMFISLLRDRQQRMYMNLMSRNGLQPVRFLEETPSNSLRIPFLHSIFPDARFIFIHRHPASNIGGLIDAWSSERIPGRRHDDGLWKFLYPPGWRSLVGKPAAEIAAAQWQSANTFILRDLAEVPAQQHTVVRYETLVSNPVSTALALCEFAEFEVDGSQLELRAQAPPFSTATHAGPSEDKDRHIAAIEPVLPSLQTLSEHLSALPECRPAAAAQHS